MNCTCQRSLRLLPNVRTFTTSARKAVSLGLGANDKSIVAQVVPEYPYGPTQWYKQSRTGLYGGQRIRFGNNTSEEYKTRTRRTWALNVRTKRLFSKALNMPIHLRVTTRVLRTIDKVGGLDEYLLGDKEARIKELGETGWWLRWAIMQTSTIQRRFAAERKALNLSEERLLSSTMSEVDESEVEEIAQMLAKAQDLKKELTFRVGKYKYVRLHQEQWQRIFSRREELIGELKRLSPTKLIQQWDDMEQDRIDAGSEPASEAERLRWFQGQQKQYTMAEKAYARVKPYELARGVRQKALTKA